MLADVATWTATTTRTPLRSVADGRALAVVQPWGPRRASQALRLVLASLQVAGVGVGQLWCNLSAVQVILLQEDVVNREATIAQPRQRSVMYRPSLVALHPRGPARAVPAC